MRDNRPINLLRTSDRFGVYIHIPFCASRCDYCDFATWTDREHLVGEYVDACVAQIANTLALDPFPAATSVFFGGGTPSLIDPVQLVRILDAIPRALGAEVTVECNPDAATPEQLSIYGEHGVNRLSFGVQSTSTHVLAALGRTHDQDNVARAVAAARSSGIDNINLDIIYGTPGESVADWAATINDVVALAPTHVSAYALTVEAATPLGANVRAGTAAAPDDDDQADKYEMVDAALHRHGYENYEISNWALTGRECAHNLLYWTMGEYFAVGCAAHGHANGERHWNAHTIERFISLVGGGESPIVGSERLAPEVRAEETLTLGLRTRTGVVVQDRTVDIANFDAALDPLIEAGLIWVQTPNAPLDSSSTPRVAQGNQASWAQVMADRAGEPVTIGLTARGRLMANDITARLINAGVAKTVAGGHYD